MAHENTVKKTGKIKRRLDAEATSSPCGIHCSALTHVTSAKNSHYTYYTTNLVLYAHADVALMGAEASVVIRGARHDCDRFETLLVPDDLWGDVDCADFGSA